MVSSETKWHAVVTNDKAYDSIFYYAIKATGIYCRPSCKSKLPLQQNVLFFDQKEEAIKEGFRPCKRCRPDLLDYEPLKELAEQAKQIIDEFYIEKEKIAIEIKKLGITQNHFIQLFKQYFGETPLEYTNRLRANLAKKLLRESDESIMNIALLLNFDSLSAFYTFFHKYT
ncbi:MAG: bifunctional transcriptional activator/DNA repair enzyme AdaA [Bacillaceae bacterium]